MGRGRGGGRGRKVGWKATTTAASDRSAKEHPAIATEQTVLLCNPQRLLLLVSCCTHPINRASKLTKRCCEVSLLLQSTAIPDGRAFLSGIARVRYKNLH